MSFSFMKKSTEIDFPFVCRIFRKIFSKKDITMKKNID